MVFRRVAIAIGAVALAVAGCSSGDAKGGHGAHAGAEASAAPVAGAEAIEVTAVDIGFEPDAIEVPAGERVNLTVTNEGAILHDFTLEAAHVHLNVGAGESATTSLTLDEPGTYQAVCTVPGHAEAGMVVQVNAV